MLRDQISLKVIVPILVGLIGAEVVLGLCGLSVAKAAQAAPGPARVALIDSVTAIPALPVPASIATDLAPPKAAAAEPPTTVPRPARPTPAPISEPAPTKRVTATVAGSAPAAGPVSSGATGYGCASALSYLSTHAAPGYSFVCPGYAEGHQAMTCTNDSSACPGADVIVIAVPCPAAYLNEAHNSWVVYTHQADGVIDPYGNC